MGGLSAAMAMVALLAAIAAPAAAETDEQLAVPASAASSAATGEAIAAPADGAQPSTEVTSAAPAPDEVPLSSSLPAPEASGSSEPIVVANSTDAVSPPSGSKPSVSLADETAPSKVLSSAQVGAGAGSAAALERPSEPVRRTATVASSVADVKETLDSVVSSATADLPAMPLGLDPPASSEGTPSLIPATTPASTAPEPGGRLGAGSAPVPLAADVPQPYRGPVGAGLPPLASTQDALEQTAFTHVLAAPAAIDFHSSSTPGGGRSQPSPGEPPPPPFQAPDTVAGSGASFFVPLAALLALLALAAPATFRRRREVPGFLAPVPFVCALERPG